VPAGTWARSTARLPAATGPADELHVDVMPVPLGCGLRLVDGTPPPALEEPGVEEAGARTGLRFRVVR
jgi:hypothetical protein